MKQTKRFFLGVIACAVALAAVASATAQSKDEVAKVVRISGSARYTTGGGVWQPLKVGDALKPGSVVQTDVDAGSYVDVVIGNGMASLGNGNGARASTAPTKGGLVRFQPAVQQNVIRIFENTVLGFDKLSTTDTGADVVTDTQLDLKAGHILGTVKKMNAASRYEIKMLKGVAGVRGTVYHAWADGRIQVQNGAMVYSFVDSQERVQTREVMGGQEYNPSSDQILPLSPEAIRAFGAIVPSLTMVTFMPAPVALDQTTYYVQPFMSPTEGEAFPEDY